MSNNEITTHIFNQPGFKHVKLVAMHTGDAIKFAGAPVCKVLGIANTGNAYRRLDADELSYIRRVDVGLPAGRDMVFLSESGLYKLIMRSDKPVAKRFQDWVTRTVLLAIRKDGALVMGKEKLTAGDMPTCVNAY